MITVRRTYNLFLWMLLGLLTGVLIYVCLGEIYSLLKENLPTLFPTYNIVTERVLYDRAEKTVIIFSLIINLLLVVNISSKYDNGKFEYIVTKTDGIYKIPDILKTFVCKFALPDIIASIIVSAVYFIPISFIPSQFVNGGSFIASLVLPYHTVFTTFGIVGGTVFVAVFMLISHAIALYPSLRYYRAKWLSGFAEV